MWTVLLVAAIAAPPDAATAATMPHIAATVQTGTLLFSQGDCLAVKVFTGSQITHVGAVVVESEGPVVYDAMNGPGVRKTPLDAYLRFLVPSRVYVMHPAKAFSPTETDALRSHFERELGRPYRVHHHATGERCDGVHCAEYVTDGLIAARRMTAVSPPKVSPGSLYQGVTDGSLYVDGGRYDFRIGRPAPPPGETWCQKSWRSTGECCTGSWQQLSRWFCCKTK